MTEILRIATRKSPLARWQANHVATLLKAQNPNLQVVVIPFITTGDRLLDSRLQDSGGKGLFTKELEEALLRGDADIAVHSMKDVPVELPPTLIMQAILQREDPTDAFVSNQYARLEDLPCDARIGTSSLRRWCQIKHHYPSIHCIELRGNLGTRLSALDEGRYDAIILACAGLKRLDYTKRITEQIPMNICLPAIGQGALGIECRANDVASHQWLQALHDPETARCVESERMVSRVLGGNCRLPIAAYAHLEGDNIHLQACVGSTDGQTLVSSSALGHDPQTLGRTIAQDLIQQGAESILNNCQ
ncbi:MAG: hydroxymethylbilane synthase [Candidatus Oxydemutatoraceae bacterium WSBS_2016_MAG_OTU14]